MIKKTVWFSLFLLTFLSRAHGSVGGSVDDFKNSKFAAAENFAFHDSYLITDDPVYKGKYAFNFFTPDRRYKLQLIADKRGKNIVFEYLLYPAADDQMIALKDGSIAISFVSQSSGQAVPAEQFVSIVSEANRGSRNVKYTKDINGYSVTVARYETDALSGWAIGIHK